jgi:hypothetical protein
VAGGVGVGESPRRPPRDDVQHFGDEQARVQRDRLARLQVHLKPYSSCIRRNAALEPVDVVAGAGDVVPAAEIDPLHLSKPRPELLLDGLQRRFQRVRVLLAQRVEVQPANALGKRRQFRLRADAQAGAGRAGVVEGVVLRRVLRVDPKAHLRARFARPRAVLFMLRERVEHDVAGNGRDLVELVVAEGRGEGVVLPRHVLVRQPRLE